MKDNRRVAANLRTIRLRQGYTQKNVADLLQINRYTYTYYETGKACPDAITLYRLAEIFGVSLEEFFAEPAA